MPTKGKQHQTKGKQHVMEEAGPSGTALCTY